MNITSKYRSLSVQAKAALWFTICSFLQKGISFITVPIFTRLMSTEEYGTYTVYLSWLQILTIMTSLYLFNGVYDNAMAKYEKQRDEYTSAMQGLTLVITGAVFALYCFTSGFWEKILNLPKSMILLMFLEALLSPALSYWSGRQRFEYRYRILVCVTILQALMNPIASLVLIRMNGGTAMMRILGIVGVQVCICDISMPDLSGLELLSQLPKGMATIMLSVHDSPALVEQALNAGARGFLSKRCSPDELIAAVRTVSTGGCYLTPDIAIKLAAGRQDPLTRRERQVAEKLAQGMSVKEIAAELDLSPKTVHVHRANLMEKLNVSNDVELARRMFDSWQ